MTPAQCRAARAFVDMTQAQLAAAAVVPLATIADFEAGELLIGGDHHIQAMRRALERAGIEFTGFGDRVGVKLKGRK
jgi:hypothetical protein